MRTKEFRTTRHCEERSDAAIQKKRRWIASALTGFAMTIAAVLLLSGCSQDDDWNGGGDGDAVSFTAGIEAATRTTTGGNAWLATDRVGIFMLATGGNFSTPADVLADNVQYTAAPGTPASTAAFSPTSGTPIYYPQSGNVDFIAYYPYGTAGMGAGQINNHTYNITVAGQSPEAAQNPLDVLYAKTTNVAKSKTVPVALTFGHVLSKVTLNVTLGDGLTSLSGSDVTAASFSGMPQTATLALQDGTLTAGATGDFSALKAATANAPAAATFTALLVPQTGGTNRTAVFTVDGVDYIWTIPNGETFAAGQHYAYLVTVKLSGVTVGAPTITPWTVDATHDPDTATEIGAGIAKVKIPAGLFQMGSPDSDGQAYSDEKPQHWVKLTKDFYMSKYQITNAQYAAFLNDRGISTPATATVGSYGSQTLVSTNAWGVTYADGAWKAQAGYENHPVINVTWYGAYAYAEWAGGRLPTEAEWEYACRAGTTTIYSYGDSAAGDYMWYSGNNSPNGTKAVGLKKVNPWGLYDMHGNVFEWCLDQWDGSSNYPTAATESAAVTDPLVITGSNRVLRGGSWNFNAQSCRSAYRGSASPGIANYYVGFRVAFVP